MSDSLNEKLCVILEFNDARLMEEIERIIRVYGYQPLGMISGNMNLLDLGKGTMHYFERDNGSGE